MKKTIKKIAKIIKKIIYKKTSSSLLLLNDRGMGTIEVILIIVVLIGLVVIFRSQVLGFVSTLFQKITANSNAIMS
jgi:hypothetical protein